MKLLVSDYDQTLYTNPHHLKLNIEAIREFRRLGNKFMLSTGRSFKSIKLQLDRHNIPYDYLSCLDGTVLFNHNDVLLQKNPVAADIFRELMIIRSKYDVLSLQCAGSRRMYYDKKPMNDTMSYNLIVPENIFTNALKYQSLMIEIEALMKNYPNLMLCIYAVPNMSFITMKNNGISKSSPIELVALREGISRDDIFTIGDNDNDIEMIRDFNGFAMKKGSVLVLRESLDSYNSVHQLISDIKSEKVKRRG